MALADVCKIGPNFQFRPFKNETVEDVCEQTANFTNGFQLALPPFADVSIRINFAIDKMYQS